jgi:hypothetical protein
VETVTRQTKGEKEDRPMVDERFDINEEKDKRPEEKVPTDNKQ